MHGIFDFLLQKVVFLFCSFTGPAHVDVEKLTTDDTIIGIADKKWIYTFREKTDTKSNIPLLREALEIIQKYVASHVRKNSDQLLTVNTNITIYRIVSLPGKEHYEQLKQIC